MKTFETTKEFLDLLQKNYNLPNALNEKQNDTWHSVSHAELLKQVRYLALFLHRSNIQKGTMVGILSPPSCRWTVVDLACLSIGAVSVPLFANISEDNFMFEITQTDSKTIFVAGKEQWDMYDKHKSLFQMCIALDQSPEIPASLQFEGALAIGKELDEKEPTLFDELLGEVRPEDLASIVYTSGSTGVPKGVMLTQANLFSANEINPFNWGSSDIFLSILPLAHIFGRTFNLLMMTWGVPIYYFNDHKNLGHVCQEIHPTIICVVPRLLERVYAKMVSKVDSSGFLKRAIGHWAFSLANVEKESLYKSLMHPLADKIVYTALREALGGKLRVVISGGSALNPHLHHFFLDVGLPVFQGWGLTEAAVISVTLPKDNRIGTVGPPIASMEVKLSPDGELLAKGKMVMQGYYKNKDATLQAFDREGCDREGCDREGCDNEGWFRTGDKGTIDKDGYITITGRIKDLIKTSTGEYIAPAPIEQEIAKAPFVDFAVVVADGRKFASCLIFPNLDVIHSLKKAQGEEKQSDDEFINSRYIQTQMNNLIENLNKHLNRWEQIHAFKFVLEPPTIEKGELTPSMKIKRDVILKKYQALIDSMYIEEAKV